MTRQENECHPDRIVADESLAGDDGKMSDLKIALMDAIGTICEVLVAKQVVPGEVLAEMLRRQRDTYPDVMPGAVFVINMILECLTDPARLEARKLERNSLQGTA